MNQTRDRFPDSAIIAELAQLYDNAISAGAMLARCGIDATQYPPFGTPDIRGWWGEVGRRIDQGRHGADAWQRLIATARQDYPGNRLLNGLPHPAPTRAHDGRAIFLSYASADRAEVDALYAALVAADGTAAVFQDHRSIAPGEAWLDTIRAAANQSSVLVCWVTPSFPKCSFCSYEIGIAETIGAKIVPIWVDGLDPKSAAAYLSGKQGRNSAAPHDFAALADWLIKAL